MMQRRSGVVLSLAVSIVACADRDPTPRRAQQPLVGGEIADHPAVGLLKGTSYCTATLIHPRAALTAAHCVQRQDGSIPLPLELKLPGSLHGAGEAIPHPDYLASVAGKDLAVEAVQPHDVALLILDSPASAPVVPLASRVPATGDPLQLWGCGNTGTGTHDSGTCRRGVTSLAHVTELVLISYGEAAGQTGGAGHAAACHGDSGGPTLAILDGSQRLVGVHSTNGTYRDVCGVETWDARVDIHLGWIADVLASRLGVPRDGGPADGGLADIGSRPEAAAAAGSDSAAPFPCPDAHLGAPGCPPCGEDSGCRVAASAPQRLPPSAWLLVSLLAIVARPRRRRAR